MKRYKRFFSESVIVKYQLKKKNDYEYLIKNSKKVVERINVHSKGEYAGFHIAGKIFSTLQLAIDYFISTQENYLNAITDQVYKINVDTKGVIMKESTSKLLGTSPSLESVKKLLADFWYGDAKDYSFNEVSDNEWTINNSKGLVDGFRIIKKNNRYRFEYIG